MSLIHKDSPALAALAKDMAWGRKFLVWIGSGLSIPAGLPAWGTLRTRLETRLSAAAPRKLPDLSAAEAKELVSHIKRIPDPWEAFEILRARLGEAEYRQVVNLALDDSSIRQPPATLERIWRNSNVDGIISLNLDNLASRAFAQVNGGRRELLRATGVSLKNGLRYLSAYQPFLVQLHGRIDDETSWVFTRSDLDKLFSDETYRTFVRSSLTARRVLFIGCSPDDIAVMKHFEMLSELSSNMPDHYWFVPNHEMNLARETKLGKVGVNLVEYTVDRTAPNTIQNNQHIQALKEFFDYLETYQYSEPEPEPINPMAGPSGARLPPDRVQALAPEQARNILSRYASAILEVPREQRMADYQAFLTEYGAAIAVASYVPRITGANLADIQVFGHRVNAEVGEGAFSRVLRATAADGATERAIKLVRNEVRDDPVMLRSFRRGVRSMQILSEKGVSGMVAYDQAYEIPPCVIMPFVDGANLEELGKRSGFSFMDHGLPILSRVADIVHSAHNLSERVLHRDLRPSNIMVRQGGRDEAISGRVVVLDFDLSWHEGADTDSPISPNMTTVLGYLAPEQITHDLSISSRHARVDTFGLCMSLYFVFHGDHPDFRSRASKDWSEIRNQLGRRAAGQSRWKSLATRVRRLIHLGTEPDQDSRLDFDVVVRELHLLQVLSNLKLESLKSETANFITLEALAEEIFARGLNIENYQWSSSAGSGKHMGVHGIVVDVSIEEHNGEYGIRMNARKQFDGTQSFATVRKYWSEHQREIASAFNRAGWVGGTIQSSSNQEIALSFFAPESVAWSAPLKLASGVTEAWKRLNMA
jgi:serine/threonine protein kinase